MLVLGSSDLFVEPPLFAPLRCAARCRLSKKSQLLFNVNVSAVRIISALLLYFIWLISGASAFFGVARLLAGAIPKKLTVSSTTVRRVFVEVYSGCKFVL